MIYDLNLAWRNLRNRTVETLIPVLVIALAIALSVAVIALADGAEAGIVQASDPFGVLVIGAPGSGQQLVLSSILLQGSPTGNISFEIFEQLDNDERVRLAVPLALGDNVGGARIIGTTHDFFELRIKQTAPPAFQIAEGRLFEEEEHEEGEHEEGEEHILEAVLGAEAAQRLGLDVGDQFRGTHGIASGIAENLHEDVYTVVGILAQSGTAYDTAVYTSIESVWEVHAEAEEIVGRIPNLVIPAPAEAGAAAAEGQVTSILVLPVGFIEQNQIFQELYVDPTVQVALPGQELGALLDLLNQGQRILNLVGYLVLGIAALTLFLSMYSTILARQQSIAIMRSMGSGRSNVFRVILFETLLLSLLGSIFGRLIGYLAAAIIAGAFRNQSSIPIPIRLIPELELLLWIMAVGVGIAAGLVPAAMAYRVNVVEKLFPA